jgi:hypothetical protein
VVYSSTWTQQNKKGLILRMTCISDLQNRSSERSTFHRHQVCTATESQSRSIDPAW